MKACLIFILIFLNALISKAQGCDSLQTVLSQDIEYDETVNSYFSVNTIVGSRITETAHYVLDTVTMIYNYFSTDSFGTWDTLGAQIYHYHGNFRDVSTYTSNSFLLIESYEEETSDGAGGWNLSARTEYYYTVTQKDSTVIKYNYPNNIQTFENSKSWSYDANDSVILYLEFQNFITFIDTVAEIITSYTVNSSPVVRVDSVYDYSFPDLFPVQIRYYTELTSSEEIYWFCSDPQCEFPMTDHFTTTEHQCGITYSYTYLSPFTNSGTSYAFDGLCRPLVYSVGGINSGAGFSGTTTNYNYASCNIPAELITRSRGTICSGDSVVMGVTISGGAAPYRIHWSPSAYLLSDTTQTVITVPQSDVTYTCSVTDANGHTSSSQISLYNIVARVPLDLRIISSDSTGCSSDLLAADSSQSFFYKWFYNGSVIAPVDFYAEQNAYNNGEYIVMELSANHCQQNHSDTILINNLNRPGPDVSITQGCNELTANSQGNVHFSWYRNNMLLDTASTIIYSGSDIYSVTATDSSGCISDQTGINAVYFYAELYLPLGCPDTCGSNGQVFIGGAQESHGYSYLWMDGDTLSYDTALCPELITATITDQTTGCMVSDSESCLNTFTEHLPELQPEADVYPNPFSNETTFRINVQKNIFPLSLLLTDMYGKIVFTDKIFSNEYVLGKNNIPAGIYLYRIAGNEGKIFQGKIIVQ